MLYTDISELKKRETEIRHLAYHDPLTELPNRTLFNDRVARNITRRNEKHGLTAVMCLDLDRFKSVNDSLGHAAGDALLTHVGKQLKSCLRGDDTVARLGGDEFGVVFNCGSQSESILVAQRILRALSEPLNYLGRPIATCVSIGIVLSDLADDTASELLKKADLALYRAKAEGRGTFRFFEIEMDEDTRARLALENDLRQAIDRNELEVHYQPQVHASSATVSGFEALIRWRHPVAGLISPAKFIPLAEEIGMINQIGAWVLKQASCDATRWPGDIKVAVNVSPMQVKQKGFAQSVEQALIDSGLAPQRLELEVTESVLLDDAKTNLAVLHHFKGMGIAIAMDDFGTGYSSLANLRSFPFDRIKIDRSFIHDMSECKESEAIVRAVLALSRSLGIVTTAEGVETEQQLAWLRAEGCSEIQGFYYSQAKPANELSFVATPSVVTPTPRS